MPIVHPPAARDVIVGQTYRGLWYEDGRFVRVLEPGRHEMPRRALIDRLIARPTKPKVEVKLVDLRERDLTIRGQEILTGDKVSVRVTIVVRFRVVDPAAAMHEVENYEDRLYTDAQLAARRSLAGMPLDEILTDRDRLSGDIMGDVVETAARYGVAIVRADVKDLVFPGNLQEIMNRVLAAERNAQANLVEARAKADVRRIESEASAEARRVAAAADAEAARLASAAELEAVAGQRELAAALDDHPALLRLEELRSLRELASLATARIYIGFDKHAPSPGD